jgi:hypothetical protein
MAKQVQKKEVPSQKEFEFKDRMYLLKGNATPISFMLRSKHSPNKPLLYFDQEQVELQKFLTIYHPDNNNAYYEFDAEEKAAEEYDELTTKLDAQVTAREMPIEELEAIARVVLKGKVELLTSSELRRDMLIYASRNPAEFNSLVNDDSIKFRNIAIRAVQMDIINVSSDGRTVNWSGKDKGRIITVPFGENAYSALAAFFLTDEGMDVLSDISNKL